MRNIISVIVAYICISVSFSQETFSAHLTYERAWNTAMLDGAISSEERALLNILSESLAIPQDSVTVIENILSIDKEDVLDQSGRWPLVLQNMIIGAGIYGWTIPYVLNAEDFRWYAGTEMLSLGGAFYLTYKYTKEMKISHARAQMMRYGGLVGLRYGLGINTIFDLYNREDDEYNTIEKRKAWALILMASVPAGIYGGDYLFSKLDPTNGQAWVLTQWTAIGGISSRAITNFFDPDPYYNNEDDYHYDDEEYEQREKDYEAWNRRHTSIELLVGYPLGFYLGQKLTMDKNYSFGDALMLYQGYGYGFFNTMMLQEILFNEFDEKRWMLFNTIGAIGSMFFYDRWIADEDYATGHSILLALGSASGLAFGFGTAIILDVQDIETMMAMALAGYGFGTYFTRKIVDVYPDGSLADNSQLKFYMMPTIFPSRSNNQIKMVPGLSLQINF